jgi:hypothetical protein
MAALSLRQSHDRQLWRDPPIDPMVQSPSAHIHRRLHHTSRQGRPWSGRSTSSTRGQSLTWATTPHYGHPTDRVTVSTWILPTPPRPSSTARNERDVGESDHPHQRAYSHFPRGSSMGWRILQVMSNSVTRR